jgi:hypothetical protein
MTLSLVGVRAHLVEQLVGNAGLVKLLFQSGQVAELLRGRAVRRGDKRLRARQRFRMQVLQLAGAEKNAGGNIERELVHFNPP